jgi:hypothetical protein
MVTGVGRKTSVYLTDDLAESVKASGVPLAELIRRGLSASTPDPLEDRLAAVIRDEFARWAGLASPGTVKRPATLDPPRTVGLPAGTAVFAEPGGEAVVSTPVPARTVAEAREQLDRTVARKGAAKGQCEHRVKSGSYCTRCGRLI